MINCFKNPSELRFRKKKLDKLDHEDGWWLNYKTIPAEDATDTINVRIEKLEQKLVNT